MLSQKDIDLLERLADNAMHYTSRGIGSGTGSTTGIEQAQLSLRKAAAKLGSIHKDSKNSEVENVLEKYEAALLSVFTLSSSGLFSSVDQDTHIGKKEVDEILEAIDDIRSKIRS